MFQRDTRRMICAGRLPHYVEATDVQRLEERVKVVHFGGDGVNALRIFGHPVAKPVRRQHAVLFAEVGEDRAPGVGAGSARRPRAMHQQDHVTATDIVVARARAVDVDEFRDVLIDRAARRCVSRLRQQRGRREQDPRCE